MGRAQIVVAGKMPLLGYIETDAFINDTTFWHRLLYTHVAVTAFRFKYYFAWYFAEAGCVAGQRSQAPRTGTR